MATTIGNTTWYASVVEWRAAGSPAWDGTPTGQQYIIGTPPKPGEPATGVKTSNGGVVPFSGYDPTKSPTYKVPGVMPTYPPPTQGTPPQPYSPTRTAVADVNTRVDAYNAAKSAYESHVTSFDTQWAGLTASGQFTGNSEQYQQYKKDLNALDLERIHLDMDINEINARTKDVDRIRADEMKDYVEVGKDTYVKKADWDALGAKYQAIARERGFDAMNQAIQTDNKDAIHSALVDRFEQYKKPDGTYDLTKAVKDGLGEKTIATAFGEDAAHGAVVAAGPPPKDGWGPKAPTLPRAIGVVTSETLFPPAKQWVEPELHYKATGMDWAVGIAQLSLMVADPLLGAAAKAGMAGARGAELLARGSQAAARANIAAGAAGAARVASTGIKVAATAIFTADTVANFGELRKNPWQLAVAIGMDALVAGAAMRALSPGMTAKLTGQLDRIAANERGGSMLKGGHTPQVKAGPSLGTAMQDIHDAVVAGDRVKLERASQNMRDWAQHNPRSPVSSLVDRRATDFLKHPNDYLRLRDVAVETKEGFRPNEVLRAKAEGIAGNMETVNSLDDFLKAREAPGVTPDTPISKQSIAARLKAKDLFDARAKAAESKIAQTKAQFDAAAKSRAYAEEIAKLKAEAAQSPLSRQSVRERLAAKALTDAKLKAVSDAHDTLKARVEVEKALAMFTEQMEAAKAEAAKNPVSRQSVRERLKAKANIDAKAQAVTDAQEKLRASVDAEARAQRAVASIYRLKEQAAANPLSKFSVREQLQGKFSAEARAQAVLDAQNTLKARIDAERAVQTFSDDMARLKAEAAKNPLSRQSVRERLRVKTEIDAKAKALTDAQQKLKTAIEAEKRANAFVAEMERLKAEAAENPVSRQSVRERLREKTTADAKAEDIASEQAKIKAKYEADAKAKADADLKRKIDAAATEEAKQRLENQKPEPNAGEKAKKPAPEPPKEEPPERQGGSEPKPESERGGGGEGGTRTVVKEKTDTRTRVEQEAEKILREKEAKAEPKTEAAPEERAETKPRTEAKPAEEVRPKIEAKPESKPEVKAKPELKTETRTTPLTTTRTAPAERTEPRTESMPGIRTRTVESEQVKPGEETRTTPAEQVQPVTQPAVNPVQKTQPVHAVKPVEQVKPLEETKPVEGVKPVEQIKTRERTQVHNLDRQVTRTKERPTEAQIRSAGVWPQGIGFWYVWKENGRVYAHFHKGKRPLPGTQGVRRGPGEAYRGIQDPSGGEQFEGSMSMGIVRVQLSQPKRTPGKRGAIGFTQDTGKLTQPRPKLTQSRPKLTPKRELRL
jgi:hypothetical protein